MQATMVRDHTDKIFKNENLTNAVGTVPKVSIVKCESYKQKEVDRAVKEALELIDFKFKKKAKILLKPNMLHASSPEKAVTTNPTVLISLCKLLKGCDLYIGDSPDASYSAKGAWDVFRVSGILDVAKKFNATFINFNTTKLAKFTNEKNVFLKEVYLPKLINEMDLIINLPKLKTHCLMRYTGAIKNLYGFIPGRKKIYFHLVANNEEKLGKLLVELYQYIRPELTIMDAIVGMEGVGPYAGNPKKTNLVLASTDCLSLDLVASEIIGFKAKDVPTSKIAIQQGLYKGIEIVGLKNVRIRYKKAIPLELMFPKFLRRIIFNKKIEIENKECKKCYRCYHNCPAGAIEKKDGKLIVNRKKCIRCFCCQEFCPYKTIKFNQGFIFNLASKIGDYSERLRGKLHWR